jgi:hypothetical protein
MAFDVFISVAIEDYEFARKLKVVLWLLCALARHATPGNKARQIIPTLISISPPSRTPFGRRI